PLWEARRLQLPQAETHLRTSADRGPDRPGPVHLPAALAVEPAGLPGDRGNLLVVPIERSLVYVEPLYIAAEKGQLPELKRVIVGFGDRIAMEETLDGALARVFGGLAPRAGAEAPPGPPAGAERSVKTLLDAAASS